MICVCVCVCNPVFYKIGSYTTNLLCQIVFGGNVLYNISAWITVCSRAMFFQSRKCDMIGQPASLLVFRFRLNCLNVTIETLKEYSTDLAMH